MKITPLAVDIKKHVQQDYSVLGYTYVFVLALVLLIFNYSVDFERTVIKSYYGTLKGVFVYIIYYSLPYYSAVVPFLLIKEQGEKLKSTTFWIKSFLFLCIIGSFSAWSAHNILAEYFSSNYAEKFFLKQLLVNLKKVTPYLITLFIVYLIFDRQSRNFYGLSKTNISYRPFLFMLVLVMPLIIAASFLPDFRAYYPKFKYWNVFMAFDLSKLEMNVLFMFSYALDFVSVELMFRGALVVGMVKLLGKEAVLPMALVYMVFHFGKPLGETISSFFGGYLLGVLSFKHQNINGGIIVHIGLAWMMELAAIAQHLFNKT